MQNIVALVVKNQLFVCHQLHVATVYSDVQRHKLLKDLSDFIVAFLASVCENTELSGQD